MDTWIQKLKTETVWEIKNEKTARQNKQKSPPKAQKK